MAIFHIDYHVWCVDKETGEIVDKDFPELYRREVSNMIKMKKYAREYEEWYISTIPFELAEMVVRQKEQVSRKLKDVKATEYKDIEKELGYDKFGYCGQRAMLLMALNPSKYELCVGSLGIRSVPRKRGGKKKTKTETKKNRIYWIIGNGRKDYNDTSYLDELWKEVSLGIREDMRRKIGRVDYEYLRSYKEEFYNKGRIPSPQMILTNSEGARRTPPLHFV